MDDLKKLDLVNLKAVLETVEKTIECEKEFLGELASSFIQNGELCAIIGVNLIKVREMIDKRTGKLKYSDKQLLRTKKGIDDLRILNERRNNIVLEIKRRELGDKYFENMRKYDLEQRGHGVKYRKEKSMKQFFNNLIKEEKYKYILINKITFNDDRIGEAKYTVYTKVLYIPKDEQNNIKLGEIRLDGLFGGIASTEEELGRRINVKKPEPIKAYLDIDILENMNNPEKRLIRDVEKEAEKNNYKLIVEKGNNNKVNYLLYDEEKYYDFVERLEKELLEICKGWNEEEFIRLTMDLGIWKGKIKSTITDEMIKSLAEIIGNYEIWYVENNFETPTIEEYIIHLRKEIKDLVTKILEANSDIKKLNTEIAELQKRYDNDIENFPEDLLSKLEDVEREAFQKGALKKEIEKLLWGTVEKSEEGLIWKHDRMVFEFKKIKIGKEDVFEKLSRISIEKQLEKINKEIIKVLTFSNITWDENKLNDIALQVIEERLDNEQEFYEEMLDEKLVDSNLDRSIKNVIARIYKINLYEEPEKIKFATPKANRDARLIELNEIMGHLEELKVLHSNEKEYVRDLDKQLEYYEKERSELSTNLIGDTILKTDIKQRIRKIVEDTKNENGLSYLGEIEYDKQKNYLIEEGGNRIFNKISINELDKNRNEDELNDFITAEIWKVLPELDSRFLMLEILKIGNEVTEEKNNMDIKDKTNKEKGDNKTSIDKLEKELKELEIRLEGATEKDLPYRFRPNPKINGYFINIIDIHGLKKYFQQEITSKKKEIALLKLDADTEEISRIKKDEIKQRSRNKIANEIIAEEVIKMWDDGLEEFEEIYKKLSESSEKIFNTKLTEGQIKGKYQRYANKHKDYKREKYK